MKTEFKFIFLLFFSVLIISCSDNPQENQTPGPPVSNDSTFKYPYQLNREWYYATRNFVTNIRPDSINVYFPGDTTLGFGAASYIKDTIINTDTLKLLRNTHTDPHHGHTTLELYKQTDTGLIRIAFFSDGANFGPYRPVNNFKFTLHGKSFNSPEELLKNSEYGFEMRDTNQLIFDDPPIKVLKYPVSQNNEWDFLNYGTTRITKKYTNYETVTVPAGTFYCIKIKRNIYYNSAAPDPDYIYYDYFSKDGMIKRDFLLKDIMVSNNFGQTIGYIDVKEEAFLNIYIIP